MYAILHTLAQVGDMIVGEIEAKKPKNNKKQQ